VSYLAIARKYRPATFDGIVGQDHVTRTLRNALERGRIHHAFLFTGARGVGKTTAARALARSLNCEQGPTPAPCEACLSCNEITAGMSPDLIEIDGASNNSVDDVRELREAVRYAPTHGRYKIYLIDEVHMLSKGAFNALLKTLEEPPAHVVFIFATTEPNRIPETILSRVQRFDFKRLPVVAMVERLGEIARQEGASLSDNALRLISRAGEGSMRDAQSLLDLVISYAGPEISDDEVAETLGLIDRSLLYDTLSGLIEGRPDQCLDAIDQVYRYGYELSQFTGDLLELLRNATFTRLSKGARRYVDLTTDEMTRLDELVAEVDPEVLTRSFAALLEVHDQVSRATRPRIVLEMAIARLASIRPVQPVGVLLERLETLERQMRLGGNPAPVSGYRGGAKRPRSAPAPVLEESPARKAPTPSERPPPRKAPTPRRAPAPSEPPPPSEAAPPAASEAPTPEPPSAWSSFCAAIAGVKDASYLTGGEPSLIGNRLRVVVTTTRVQAAARRVAGDSEVQQALEAVWPGATLLVVTPSEPDAQWTEADETLKQTALEDPAIRRIVDTLGADLENVTPLDDGEKT
jgi:DNA polymerase-3 subunit gamma/tau